MRWSEFAVLCIGALMVVIDSTVVVVALPSIGSSLKIDQDVLVEVVNVYTAANGGFLLCSGKLGDLFGLRRLFLAGVALFTAASVGCALSGEYVLLIVFRVFQGLSGAAVITATYSSAVAFFPRLAERARALSVLSFVSSAGGVLGLLFGGALTESLGWRWIFLINVPIGVGVFSCCLVLMKKASGVVRFEASGLLSGTLITVSLILLILAIQDIGRSGGSANEIPLSLGAAGSLVLALICVEKRAPIPSVPLRLLRSPNFALCGAISVLTSLVGASSIFVSMYLQLALRNTPNQVSTIFLLPSLISAVFFLGLSAKIVTRFGTKAPLTIGLVLGSSGLLILSHAVVTSSSLHGLLLGLAMISIGVGVSSTPNLVAAMGEVMPIEAGLGTGMLATATMMGSAVGLAALGSVLGIVQRHVLMGGAPASMAVVRGYQIVFLICAVSNAVAIPFALKLRRTRQLEISYDRACQ